MTEASKSPPDMRVYLPTAEQGDTAPVSVGRRETLRAEIQSTLQDRDHWQSRLRENDVYEVVDSMVGNVNVHTPALTLGCRDKGEKPAYDKDVRTRQTRVEHIRIMRLVRPKTL